LHRLDSDLALLPEQRFVFATDSQGSLSAVDTETLATTVRFDALGARHVMLSDMEDVLITASNDGTLAAWVCER
jgi:hypothetical protein